MKLTFSPKTVAATICLLALLCLAGAAAQGQALTTLYSFKGGTGDGAYPYGGLVIDGSGNLYGTTYQGGNTGCTSGCGIVFELVNSSGTYSESVLHTFTSGTDGGNPYAGNLLFSSGTLFGATRSGGTNSTYGNNGGTVFSVTPSGPSESVQYTFPNTLTDGVNPNVSLLTDGMGDLYGTTTGGGANGNYGTVFELVNNTGTYMEYLLYSFAGTTDGVGPNAGLVKDSSGNLYGTTQSGGSGYGTVFEVSPNGEGGSTKTTLYSFAGASTCPTFCDGATPYAGLVMDTAGNLYGTTGAGGTATCACGTVFELASNGEGGYTYSVLYSFTGGNAGGTTPYGALVVDSGKNLYGTTWQGGTNNSGTIFELVYSSGSYTEKLLYSFTGSSDGGEPYAGLITDGAGNFYGTTTAGGSSSDGTVFRLGSGCPNFPNYAPDFTSNQGCLMSNGSASFQTAASGAPSNVSKVLRLTPNSTGQAGSTWYKTPQQVAGNWSSTFTFQLSGANTADGPADGIAFGIQNSALTALGPGGCGMGFAEDTSGSCASSTGGIPNSLMVAFKTYNDGYPDPNNNSVLIVSNGTGAKCIDQSCSIAYNNTFGVTLADGNVHTVTINYVLQPTSAQTNCAPGGTPGPCLDVILDGNDLFPVGVSVNLNTLLSLTGGNAWVGFTGGTGGGDDNQDILSWIFTIGQSQTGAVTLNQPATFNFNGGCSYNGSGCPGTGYTNTVSENSGSSLTINNMVVTPIPQASQAVCNAIVQANSAFNTAECFVYVNGGGQGIDAPVMFAITCPPSGICDTTESQFYAAIDTYFSWTCADNQPLSASTCSPYSPPSSFGFPNLTSTTGLPAVGILQGAGSDPNNPCSLGTNTPPLFVSNQIAGYVLGDTSSVPVKGYTGLLTSCLVATYNTPGEIPTATITSTVNTTYQQGATPSAASYTCTVVTTNPSGSATYPSAGPYLTMSSCNATSGPTGGGGASQTSSCTPAAPSLNTCSGTVNIDTTDLGPLTVTVQVEDSAMNTAQQQAPYTVVPPTETIGGTVSGLSGSGLVLSATGEPNLTVTGNGNFTFATPLNSGSSYTVSIYAQPTGLSQTCSVTSGAVGTVASAPVTNVVVSCVTNTYTLGGSVSGLSGGGLVLQDNGGNNLSVSAGATSFSFGAIASGSAYNITVYAQPSTPSQTCSVTNGTGTVTSANVATVAVSCTTNTYTLGGSVSGLSGSGLVLSATGEPNLTVTGNGNFTFATPLNSGSSYTVSIYAQPSTPSQTCSVTNGTGQVTSANVTSVRVSCTTNNYTIGGTVSGLSGSGLVLLDNGGNSLSVAANATAFTFTTPIASGGTYAVTVGTQPSTPSQTCSVTNGTGTVTSANVTSVVVTCTTNSYRLTTAVSPTGGGTVSPASGNSYLWGTSVPLVAAPSAGYVFSNWTASPLAVVNASSASTSVTMTAPESVTANFTSALTVVPSSVNWGTVYQGTITTKTITVYNTGTAPITMNEPLFSIVKGQSSAWVVVSLCPKSLKGGSNCPITISFVAGAYYLPQSGVVNIMDNAPPPNPQPVTVTALVIDPKASFSPTTLSFGALKHATSSTLDVTLSNPGGTPLIFTGTGISVKGTNAADFVQSNNCGSSLAAGAKCTIAVKFTPPTTGTFSANLTVTDNAQAGAGTQTVPLSGKGD